jgi:hypothetical protein
MGRKDGATTKRLRPLERAAIMGRRNRRHWVLRVVMEAASHHQAAIGRLCNSPFS